MPPKEPLPERFKAKQFATAPPREGKTLDVYFEKKYNYIAEVSTSKGKQQECICSSRGAGMNHMWGPPGLAWQAVLYTQHSL